MTRVIVDEALRKKLHDLKETLELCDDAGHVLGRVTPVFDPALYEGLEPDISDEEIERRMREGGGRTLAEILADLEKRA
jgi:hypothetical protein